MAKPQKRLTMFATLLLTTVMVEQINEKSDFNHGPEDDEQRIGDD
jgi:hypothetical protein